MTTSRSQSERAQLRWQVEKARRLRKLGSRSPPKYAWAKLAVLRSSPRNDTPHGILQRDVEYRQLASDKGHDQLRRPSANDVTKPRHVPGAPQRGRAPRLELESQIEDGPREFAVRERQDEVGRIAEAQPQPSRARRCFSPIHSARKILASRATDQSARPSICTGSGRPRAEAMISAVSTARERGLVTARV